MRKKTSALKKPNALNKALSLLTFRDHSEAELLKKLHRYDLPAEEIDSAIRHCREYGYLDDYKFALVRARALMIRGRAVGPKVMDDLRRRGIEKQVAQRAIQEVSSEINEEEVLAAVLEKRFAGFSFLKARDNEKKRVVNYLLRRGFSLATVLEFFKGEREKKNHDNGQ